MKNSLAFLSFITAMSSLAFASDDLSDRSIPQPPSSRLAGQHGNLNGDEFRQIDESFRQAARSPQENSGDVSVSENSVQQVAGAVGLALRIARALNLV